MADERGFLIDGEIVPLVAIDSFTMGDRNVFWDYTGQVQEDYIQQDGESDQDHEARTEKLSRHPGYWQTMMHIAYQRKHPELSRQKVAALIENTNYVEALSGLGSDEADDASPPASESTSKPNDRSSTGSVDSNDSSGDSSTSGSVQPADAPTLIGTTRSGTSPTSVRETSAA